MLKPKKKKT